jgi:hypothetical protein
MRANATSITSLAFFSTKSPICYQASRGVSWEDYYTSSKCDIALYNNPNVCLNVRKKLLDSVMSAVQRSCNMSSASDLKNVPDSFCHWDQFMDLNCIKTNNLQQLKTHCTDAFQKNLELICQADNDRLIVTILFSVGISFVILSCVVFLVVKKILERNNEQTSQLGYCPLPAADLATGG